MQKAFEKIVERLEEKKKEYLDSFGTHGENELYGIACGFGDSIKIVNQVAEEYKADIEFAEKCIELAEKMNICDLVAENQRLSRKIMFLEAEKESNDVWIPCSERLPERNKQVLCWAKSTARGGDVCFTGSCDNGAWFLQTAVDTLSYPTQYEVVAWRELPAPYQPKGE